MKTVLIFWLLSGPSNFAPTGTAIFDDQPACEVALQAIADEWSQGKGKPGICVPQASEEATPEPKAPSAPSKATAPVAKK